MNIFGNARIELWITSILTSSGKRVYLGITGIQRLKLSTCVRGNNCIQFGNNCAKDVENAKIRGIFDVEKRMTILGKVTKIMAK